jgi:LuxR family transcriptional regulator, maltose regulon positive regulatory protein
VLHRAWLQPALRACPELAAAYHGLMRAGAARAGQGGPAAASRLNPVVVERLSDREREVLRLVAALLSTEEVAREMYLSGNTVKTHLRSIFRKLGVTRRGEAVRRARQLGLL